MHAFIFLCKLIHFGGLSFGSPCHTHNWRRWSLISNFECCIHAILQCQRVKLRLYKHSSCVGLCEAWAYVSPFYMQTAVVIPRYLYSAVKWNFSMANAIFWNCMCVSMCEHVCVFESFAKWCLWCVQLHAIDVILWTRSDILWEVFISWLSIFAIIDYSLFTIYTETEITGVIILSSWFI